MGENAFQHALENGYDKMVNFVFGTWYGRFIAVLTISLYMYLSIRIHVNLFSSFSGILFTNI